jgi:succinoglycan biosynthesis transport protein ExoP
VTDPQVQVLVSPTHAPSPPYGMGTRGGRSPRLRIFLVVFVLAAAAGLSYTFVRPAVYRSTATLVIVPPVGGKAVSSSTASNATAPTPTPPQPGNADANVVVQSQMIGSQSILARLYDRMRKSDPVPKGMPGSLAQLQDMVSVVPVNGANMVELRAEGAPPAMLTAVVNKWIDVYLDAYAASQAHDSDSAGATLERHAVTLKQKIEAKRAQLDAFRARYDIVSIERDENRVLARLKGLNTSLDKANDNRAAAEAHLSSLRQAIAAGQPQVRPQDQRGLDSLEETAVTLRQQISDLQQRFTPQYMALDKNAVAVQKRLAVVENQLKRKRLQSQRAALSDAEQTATSARQVVAKLHKQLNDYKKTASDFSARLAEYQNMRDELTQLESMQRATQDQLVQVQVGRGDLLPAVRVLERASVPGNPIRPHYLRDAGISGGVALALGLIAIWLWEFLTGRARSDEHRAASPMMYTISNPNAALNAGDAAAMLPRGRETAALLQAPARELAPDEVEAMLVAADDDKRALIGTLLSGLTGEEAVNLRWSDLDLDAGRITVNATRQVPMARLLTTLWSARREAGVEPGAPIWPNERGAPLSVSDLDATVGAVAVYGAVARPSEVDTGTLRHTYLAFLARQGLRLADLSQVAGELSDQELYAYRMLASPGDGRPPKHVNMVYPVLEGILQVP